MSDTVAVRIVELPLDSRRGTMAMWWFIVTEGALFVALFFAYFYLGKGKPEWPPDEPPKLMLASVMLVLLLASSGTLEWAKWNLRRRRHARCRAGVVATLALGATFLVLQFLEYRDHLQRLTPTSDAYGSIFYTITSVHGLHVVVGLLMLAFVVALPRLEPRRELPYHPFHNGSLYWHFVDSVWVVIVALLYVLPHFYR